MIKSNALYWPKDEERSFISVYAPWRLSTTRPSVTMGNVYCSVRTLKKGFSETTGRWTSRLERLPGEHLDQGGAFDRYGNNSVTNLQWIITLGEANWDVLCPSGVSAVFVDHPSSDTYYYADSEVAVLQSSSGQYTLVSDGAVRLHSIVSAPGWGWTYGIKKTEWRPLYVDDDADGRARFVSLRFDNYTRCRQSSGKYTLYVELHIVACYPGRNSGYAIYNSGQMAMPTTKSVYETLCDFERAKAYSASLELPPLPAGWNENPSLNGYKRYPTALVNPYEGLNGVSFDIDVDYDRLYRDFNFYRRFIETEFTDLDRSDVAADIMQSINLFDGNMIAYAKDLPRIGDSIRSVLALVRDWKNPAAWASTWLSLRFADRLTIADTSELLAAFRRDLSAVNNELVFYRSSRVTRDQGSFPGLGVEYTTSSRLTACIALSGGLLGDMENLLAAPFRWDLLPTLQNVWDMIPFSFVVDWVYDVEAILTQIDLMAETRTIDIKTQYASTRHETTLNLEALTNGRYKGTITRIWYERNKAQVDTWLRLKAFNEYWTTSVRPVNLIDSAGLLVQSLH